MCLRSCNERIFEAAALAITVAMLDGCASMDLPVADALEVESVSRPAEVPVAAPALYGLAVDALAAGDTREAERRFSEFRRLYPDHTGPYVNLAIIFAARDELDAAEQALLAALNIDPGHAAALNQLGMLHRRRGEFDAAEAAYTNAIAADPEYALAHLNLGILNDLYLRRLDAALAHYRHYESLAGEDPEVSRWMSDLERRIASTRSTASLSQ